MKTFFKSITNTIKNWYLPGIVGLLFIIFGIYLFSVPLATYFTLILFFSISFLIAGVSESFFSIQNRNELEGWVWHLAGALFNVFIGILLIANPLIGATVLPIFIGITLLFRAIQGVGIAVELKNYGIKQWWHLCLLSVLGIILSFIIIINPIMTGISLAFIIALTFVIAGISGIVVSIQLKRLKNLPRKISKELKDKIEDLKEEYYEFIDK